MAHSIIKLKVMACEYIGNFFRGPPACMRRLRLGFHLLLAHSYSHEALGAVIQCEWQSGVPLQRPLNFIMHPSVIYCPFSPYFLIHYLLQSGKVYWTQLKDEQWRLPREVIPKPDHPGEEGHIRLESVGLLREAEYKDLLHELGS